MVGTKPILDQIEYHRIKWFINLMRVNPNQPTLRTCTSQVTGSHEEDGLETIKLITK